MKFAILIGSHARGDHNSNSDCDVLLINFSETLLDKSRLPKVKIELINFIHFEEIIFKRLYDSGSLFLLHCFTEGIVLQGDREIWRRLGKAFEVQGSFSTELSEILKTTQLLSNTKIFGGRYLTPLVNAFTELKNACIFSLAHHGIYEFNKEKCLEKATQHLVNKHTYQHLKLFYDFSVREIDLILPFDPNNEAASTALLIGVDNIVREMHHACKP